MPSSCLGPFFVADNRRMKRAFVLLLMVWIALQSTLVQAHMVEQSLHQLGHTVQAANKATSVTVWDAEHDESCTVVACAHPLGAFYSTFKSYWGPFSCLPPFTVLPLQSACAVDDIERPKWPTLALGVAGI